MPVRLGYPDQRQVSIELLTLTDRSATGCFGLGLFDVCPKRDDGSRHADADGQTLNKPRRRKPRAAARTFEYGTAYGDLMPGAADDRLLSGVRSR